MNTDTGELDVDGQKQIAAPVPLVYGAKMVPHELQQLSQKRPCSCQKHTQTTIQSCPPRTDDLYDLFLLDDLDRLVYDLAHVAFVWEPYNLHDLAHVSWVGSVLYRCYTTSHRDAAQPLTGVGEELLIDESDLSVQGVQR